MVPLPSFLLRNSNLTSFFLAKQTGKQTAGFKVVGDTVVVVDLAIRYLVSGTNLLRPVNSKWMELITYIRLLKTSDFTKSHGTTKIGHNFTTYSNTYLQI